jgi:hypothetical protein
LFSEPVDDHDAADLAAVIGGSGNMMLHASRVFGFTALNS